MRSLLFCTLSLGLALVLAGFSTSRSPDQQEIRTAQPRFSVLVFTKTEGDRHASIEDGIVALKQLGIERDFTVTATENAAAFHPDSLVHYDAVIFLNTTGDVLNAQQQDAFKRYIEAGGGFAGIHAAADTEHDWPWYGKLVGAYSESSPSDTNASEGTIFVADQVHPSTEMLPSRWTRTDKWYNYSSNPRGAVHVLMTTDEESYESNTMDYDHPIAWVHEQGDGRAFYTGLGHAKGSYSEDLFLEHVLGGIEWAAGVAEGDAGATVAGSFEKVILDDQITYPMEVEVAFDESVFFIERDGAVKVWRPETQSTHMAGFIPVTTKIEDGLLGLALDPNFEENGWLYLYYSPLSEGPQRLSRFTYEDGRIDMDSEQVMLEIPVQREECCHSAGELEFGPDGNLFLSTGDNTAGTSPRLDERPGREYWDAQRTTANTNDLRGKILRITPQPDGSYTVPEDNLFEGDSLHRPEIYTMGHRNPWRISVDQETGWLYWGDVGPNVSMGIEDLPSGGYEEFNQAREAGYFGWPYFVGPNVSYRDYNFETEKLGEVFDPEHPINDSPNNTGARELPPARSAWIWYHYGVSEEFPELGTGSMSASAGPIYHYDPETVGPHGLPAYYDDSVFLYEWARNWIKEVKLDENGDIMEINPFQPEMEFLRPINMDIGPAGNLYVLEWGTPFWGSTRDARLVRLDYYGSKQRPPVASVTATPTSGSAPLRVTLDGTRSHSRNGQEPLDFVWNIEGDSETESRRPDPTFTFEEPGRHTVRLTVTDAQGMSATAEIPITVGNTAPSISVESPVEGGIFDFNQPIDYRVAVGDAEDELVAQERLIVQPKLVHNTHSHLLKANNESQGSFEIRRDDSHAPYILDRHAVLEVSYTDGGSSEAPPLTTTKRIVMQPRRLEAEQVTSNHGAELIITGNRQNPDFPDVTEVYLAVEDSNYVSYAPVNLRGIDSITFQVAPLEGGAIEVRRDSSDGPLLAETLIEKAETSDEEAWTQQTVSVEDPGGPHELFLVFRGAKVRGGEEGILMNLDFITFNGPGMQDSRARGED